MGTHFCLPSTTRNVSLTFHRRPLWTLSPKPSMTRMVSSASGSNGRKYTDAIRFLDSLQSNRTVVSSVSNTPGDQNLKAIPEMLEWTRKAGYEVDDFTNAGLRFVHVAGTKGKGSVCAMVESILLQYRKKSQSGNHELGKIGLYTSPHLVHVRERIRIDGAPISESKFTRYFFEIWDQFSLGANEALQPNPDNKPGYFRFLTILAFHVFIKEGVESAILECGIGGEYDSTNIIPAPAVTATAITRLGIDHVGMLGDTIESIAWHKAGIMKSGVPSFTVPQEAKAQAVLSARAEEKGVDLIVVPRLPALEADEIKLGLDGDFQKDNASLAIAVASSHLNTLSIPVSITPIPLPFSDGLKTIIHPGRCQVVPDGNVEWFLDGAHTVDSITQTGLWFGEKIAEAKASGQPPAVRMLIFAAQGNDRDPQLLLRTLMKSLKGDNRSSSSLGKVFTYGSFCTMEVLEDHEMRVTQDEKKRLERLAMVYQSLDGNVLNVLSTSIQAAVQMARRISKDEDRVMVLVTGSLHLVGGVMKVFEWEKQQQEKNSLLPY